MADIVVVGGGFAGCAAAIGAAKAGGKVILLERTDRLLGAGLRAGRMNMNGKFVAAEEAKALGAGDIFNMLESIIIHRGNILGEENTYVYDTGLAEPRMRSLLQKFGVEVVFVARAIDVHKQGNLIEAVTTAEGERIKGDVFVDCTGGWGGQSICRKYGKGCVMCVCFRCPAFGDRVSIATLAGVPEFARLRPGGIGAVTAAITVFKDTLARGIQAVLEQEGVVTLELPENLRDTTKLAMISAPRSLEQMNYINLVDIGPVAKCTGLGFMSLDVLRQIPGFETVQVEDPMKPFFNAIGKVSMSARDDALAAEGIVNLFCAGEKSGPGGGIAEVIVMGYLAGHNAARRGAGKELIQLPPSLAVGDFITYTRKMMDSMEGLSRSYGMGQGVYLERMKALNLYTTDVETIRARVASAGFTGVFSGLA